MMVIAVLRKTAAALVLLMATGCGSPAAAPTDREWRANAHGVAVQLHADVLAVSGIDHVRSARRALRDDSELYGLLVSYTDFGGCAHMVAALGVEPPQLHEVRSLLGRACVRLRAADRLFMLAIARDDPAVLVRATSVALRALAPLDRARIALRQ
jgi:hypothetical protein